MHAWPGAEQPLKVGNQKRVVEREVDSAENFNSQFFWSHSMKMLKTLHAYSGDISAQLSRWKFSGRQIFGVVFNQKRSSAVSSDSSLLSGAA